MNIRCLSSLLIFICFVLCQPSFAQSNMDLEIQSILNQNPSLLETFDEEKNNVKIKEDYVSENQEVVNTNNALQLDLSTNANTQSRNTQSVLNKYFNVLTGKNLNSFGLSEFIQPQDDNLLFFNMVGKDYQLAPGDVIRITITGLSPVDDEFMILNDGSVTIRNSSPINVNGLGLDEASKLIQDKIIYDDASAEVFIRLSTARLVTVQISGNVNSPRTIAVPAYTPLSRVIAYSGGISDNGSLRNISISQIGETTQFIDFYDFLQNPSSVNDPLIKNGARIFVPNKGSTIGVLGFVNNPGIYELPNDISETTIKELLDLSGTSFLPPGSTLKVLYFDPEGKASTHMVSKDYIIKEGEALLVDFIETRDLDISKIYGAVLENYEIETNKPLSIKDVLKGGAVLAPNAHYQFALIDGKEVIAINLNDALINDDIVLPTGSDLRIFSKKEYLSLVSENPNKSSNPLLSKLVKAKNLAEIYLDGMRLAYVPINPNQNLFELINNFYSPGPKTVFDIALIENNLGVEAIDLNSLISKKSHRKLNSGDRLFIFEEKFYDTLLLNVFSNEVSPVQTSTSSDINGDSIEILMFQLNMKNKEEEYLEALSYSQRILQQANLINIKLDGELFTYLPHSKGMSSSYTLKKLRNRLPKLVSEFVVVQNINVGKTPEIRNLNYPFEINSDEEINFISSKNYRLAIKNYESKIETNLSSELKASNAVEVYYDGKLVLLLPPGYRPSELNLFEQYTKKSELYKLYVGLNTINFQNGTWNLLTFGAEEFFSEANNLVLGASNVVNLFSNNFIRNEFIDDNSNINGVNFNINKIKSTEIKNLNITNPSIQTNDKVTDISLLEGNTLNQYLLSSHIEIMRNSLRTISGSVQFPGSYPVAKKIRLSNFLSTAGLIEHTAKSNIVITEATNKDDRLTRNEPKIIKFDDKNLNKEVLSGLYYLDIPMAINDSITGVIELSGEVINPGRYSFTRSETLQDIIKRAGGLSEVAFPLGAELHRISAKELEKATNNILADQLEASILNLAQSSLEGAGDQVQVVLGYATQLRNQPTVGRMALNILENNPSNPVFLEDGDKLTIPKRPSHVSVVGSVQRSTIASYVPNQGFDDYLQAAGGVTKVADTRKAYLLLPNGESRQLSKSTVIPVGSVIIVPPKLDRLSILGGTDIISKVLNNISNSILSIQNVD